MNGRRWCAVIIVFFINVIVVNVAVVVIVVVSMLFHSDHEGSSASCSSAGAHNVNRIWYECFATGISGNLKWRLCLILLLVVIVLASGLGVSKMCLIKWNTSVASFL